MQTKLYDREKAVAYAHQWALARNPNYYDFTNLGGDCTNFASQVLFAGSGVMNMHPNTGWYYVHLNSRSASWSGVPFLYNYLTKNQGVGPVAVETSMDKIEPGDIIQLSTDGLNFTHTPVVVAVGTVPAPDNILVAAHTYNADFRPLNTYEYKRARFLHITHVNSY